MLGVKAPSRCVVAHEAEKDRVSFLAGSLSLREANEIVLADAENGAVVARSTFAHQDEVWDIAPSPRDKEKLLTVHNNGKYGYRSTLWKTPAGCTSGALEALTSLGGLGGVLRRVAWHPRGGAGQVLLVGDGGARVYDVEATAEGGGAACSGAAEAGELEQMYTGQWDPHDAHAMATASGTSVNVWDTRSMAKSSTLEGAHAMMVRDVDYNPRVPHRLVTAGDDCKIRFWDLRAGAGADPLLELSGHSHWVWAARFNPQHDQLVLTASSDSLVSLWKCPGASSASSSAPGGGTPASAPGTGAEPADALAMSVDDHDDSVYSVAWSPVDPFAFASLSYSGRLVVTQVPRNIKYDVLL